MKKRFTISLPSLFLGVLLMAAGCTNTKTYKISEPGKETATLTYPSFIEIRSFDGQNIEGMLSHVIYEGKRVVVFPAGQHTVDLRYYDMWDIDDNDHEKVYSDFITLRFDAKPGTRYRISVDEPKDRRSAWKLAKHFSVDIIDERTGKPVSYGNDNP